MGVGSVFIYTTNEQDMGCGFVRVSDFGRVKIENQMCYCYGMCIKLRFG